MLMLMGLGRMIGGGDSAQKKVGKDGTDTHCGVRAPAFSLSRVRACSVFSRKNPLKTASRRALKRVSLEKKHAKKKRSLREGTIEGGEEEKEEDARDSSRINSHEDLNATLPSVLEEGRPIIFLHRWFRERRRRKEMKEKRGEE